MKKAASKATYVELFVPVSSWALYMLFLCFVSTDSRIPENRVTSEHIHMDFCLVLCIYLASYEAMTHDGSSHYFLSTTSQNQNCIPHCQLSVSTWVSRLLNVTSPKRNSAAPCLCPPASAPSVNGIPITLARRWCPKSWSISLCLSFSRPTSNSSAIFLALS